MTATAYSFWCSKCRVDHPGECPPLKNPCAEVCPTCVARTCTGHDRAVIKGSWWVAEDFDSALGVWVPRADRTYHFEVVGFNKCGEVVVKSLGSGTRYELGRMAWEFEGDLLGTGRRVRFAPMPGVVMP